MSQPLKLAVAQPESLLHDVVGNAERHAAAVRDAAARVVVFPELSLTGYSMDAQPIDPQDERLRPIAEACAAADSVAFVGAPTTGRDDQTHISMLQIDGADVWVAYNKMFLGGDEPQHFAAGFEPKVADVDGWRLGLAICKDTGVADHAARTAALGIDVYVAGVCETEEDRHLQPERAARVTGDHGVWVAYASFAGPTGGGFTQTAGRSAIWQPDGTIAAELDRQPGQVTSTVINAT